MEAPNQSGGKENQLCYIRTSFYQVLHNPSTLHKADPIASHFSLGLLQRCIPRCLPWSKGSTAAIAQRSDIRYIFGIWGMTRISPFRSKLGWLRTDFGMHYFALLTIYKVVCMKEPHFWPNYLRTICQSGQLVVFALTWRSLKPKKGVFLSSVKWVLDCGTLFPQEFFHPIRRLGGG